MLNGHTSFWLDRLGVRGPSRPALPGDVEADVAIVGAGFTGLWTAYWITRNAPGTRVAVIEARHAGYGASGRNGGWLSGKMIGLRRHMAAGPRGRDGVVAFQRAVFDAIDEVLAIMAEHGHDVRAVKGGYLTVARTAAELARLREGLAADRDWGLTEDDVRLLGADEARERVAVDSVLGAAYSPHCARLDPARLVTGIAAIAEAAGVTIYESTAALAIQPGRVVTERGVVRADVVLRATEGYTPSLPGGSREMLPMLSSMIATEPLPAAQWERIGWGGREALSAASHRYFYAQRTADDRIAIGGRGLPYRYGSRPDHDGRLDRWTIRLLRDIVGDIFPSLAGVGVDHAWCGVLGVPRDWTPSVRFDRSTGVGSAGGYVGQGVTAAYLAGRTLADLVAGESTPYTELPWTQRSWPRWEREPLRWAGAYAMYGLYQAADAAEHRGDKPVTSIFARVADKVSGRH